MLDVSIEPRINSDNMWCPRCKSGVQTYTIWNDAHCYWCASI